MIEKKAHVDMAELLWHRKIRLYYLVVCFFGYLCCGAWIIKFLEDPQQDRDIYLLQEVREKFSLDIQACVTGIFTGVVFSVKYYCKVIKRTSTWIYSVLPGEE